MNISDSAAARELPFSGLVAFEATARLGTMSAAADELHLTQSAVSQRVLKLEAFVGQRLFLRQGHGVKLTGAGELLMATAREALQRLRTGFARIEPYRNKDSLLLACPPDFAQGWLLPRLPALRALHPALEVWLMDERAVEAIDRVDVDLIVSRKPLHGPELEARPFLEDRAIAVCSPALAARLGAAPWPRLLEKAPLLFLEAEPEWGGLLSGPAMAPRAGRAWKRAATIQDARLLLEAATLGHGIAYLSERLAGAALAAGRVVVLPAVPPSPRLRLWLMRSRLTPRTPRADRACDWLLAEAGHAAG